MKTDIPDNDLISRSALMKKVLVPPCSVVSVDDIKNAPAIDAVVLPSGKIGDVVKWNTGVSFRYFTIRSIIICHDGMRYDLGEIAPFVNHRNIAGIMSEAEAEAESYEVD